MARPDPPSLEQATADAHDRPPVADGGPPADPYLDAAGNAVDREGGPFPQSVAAGDPRQRSVVLWTRVDTGAETRVTLAVAPTADFDDPVVDAGYTADPDADGCLRVKVTGLLPGRHYYYRFCAAGEASPVGRFRTAPAPGDDRPVRFALTNCQDYTGRYYNAYLPILGEDLDFALHVGDFVYETTGNPLYQSGGGGRRVEFRDPEAAIEADQDGEGYLAARSLSNYRDLYRAYRGDPVQQAVQERFAFVHVWDDHEFTDDAYGATGTYFDERVDEYDPERRRNAERAFFEYVPIDPEGVGAGAVTVTDDDLYPDSRIYRDLRFGEHLHVLLTDYRTYRPDHVIDEDAFPGEVVMTRSDVVATFDAMIDRGEIVPGDDRVRAAIERLSNREEGEREVDVDPAALQGFDPDDSTERREAAAALFEAARPDLQAYVDLDRPAVADHRETLRELLFGAYGMEVEEDRARELARQAVSGRIDVDVVNTLVDEYGLDLDGIDAVGRPRGISYAALGKLSLFGSLGSRFMVVRKPYDLYNRYRRYVLGDEAFDDVLGPEQSDWLLGDRSRSNGGPDDAAGASHGSTGRLGAHPDASWKALVSSVSMTSMRLPLSDPPAAATDAAAELPAEYRREFYLNCEQWDGFPLRRRDLFEALSGARSRGADPTGAVVLSGDIHATFVSDHGTPADGGLPLFEFTAPAITSDTQETMVRNKAREAEGLDTARAHNLIDHLEAFLQRGNPGIEAVDTDTNGVVTCRADGEAFEATYHHVSPELVESPAYEDPESVLEAVERRHFRVQDGQLQETE